MKLFRMLAAWLAAFALFSGLTAAVAPAAHADSGSEEAQFLALTNQLRAGLGIQQLTPNAQLTSMARNWSAKMAAAGGISHNPSITSQAPSNWTQLGENVGVGPTVDAIQTAFIKSPEHYANLSKGAYNFVGIGVVDSNGAIYVTVDFMAASGGGGASAPRSTPPKATSAPRTVTPAAPRPTTPRTAPPATAPPTPAPTPVPHPTTPVVVKRSVAFPQVLEELRSVDVTR